MSQPSNQLTPQQLQQLAAQQAPPVQQQPQFPQAQFPQFTPQAPALGYPPFTAAVNPYAAVPPQQVQPPQQPPVMQPQQLTPPAGLTPEQAQQWATLAAQQAALGPAGQQQAPQAPAGPTPQQLNEQIQALQAQQKAQEDAARAAQTQALIAGGDYKTLYEQSEARAKEIEANAKKAVAESYLHTALANAKVVGDPAIALAALDASKITDPTSAAREVYALQQRAGHLFAPPALQLPNAGAPLQVQQQPAAPGQPQVPQAPPQGFATFGSWPTQGGQQPIPQAQLGHTPVKSAVDTMAEGYAESAAQGAGGSGSPALVR